MTAAAEKSAITAGRGKWSLPGVPHKGWECVDIRDLREDDPEAELETCEMCESTEIRYVHVMHHTNYPTNLECGCVCAGHMEQNYEKAAEREKGMRSRADRRRRFPTRKGWELSSIGTPYIKIDGYHVVIAKRGRGYAVGIKPPGKDRRVWGRKTYPDIRAAQFGAFNGLEYLKAPKR